jgi:LacI family transcriptional regulator
VGTVIERGRSVAVCIDTRDGAGRSRLHGVAQYVRLHGWRMMLVRQGGRAAAQEVARLSPDGIVAYIADRGLLETARRLRIPLVDTALGDVPVGLTVSIDNAAIARLAAEHLAEAGLRHFGYCGVAGRTASEERRACFAAALAALAPSSPPHGTAGTEPGPPPAPHPMGWRNNLRVVRGLTGDGTGALLPAFSEPVAEGESGLGPMMRWLRKLPKPVGLLVFDDKLGERVLTACRWARLAVPQQVAVLGIGDDELMCEVSWPTLSSVRLPTPKLGFEAARVLAAAMAGGRVRAQHIKLQPLGVVARGSTDTVAVEDSIVRSAVQFVRAEAGGLIGSEQVAAALGVSRRTLDRRFERALGRTVREELVRVRMQTARTLLADRSRRIAGVARACGYATPASFSRAFRRHSGRWPSEYREDLRIL